MHFQWSKIKGSSCWENDEKEERKGRKMRKKKIEQNGGKYIEKGWEMGSTCSVNENVKLYICHYLPSYKTYCHYYPASKKGQRCCKLGKAHATVTNTMIIIG